MKVFIVLSLILLIPFAGISQTEQYKDTIYFNSDWKKSNQKEYKYYRIYSKSDFKFKDKYLIKITDYYKNNKIQMIGFKQTFESKERIGLYSFYNKKGKLKSSRLYKFHQTIGLFKSMQKYADEVKQIDSTNVDLFVSFFFKGHVKEIGYYSKNCLQVGEWKEYNPFAKKLYRLIEYDKHNYFKSILTFHSNGKLWEEKYFKNGLKNGTWKFYKYNGELKKKKVYKNDKLIKKIENKLTSL